jgi:hypothetical protein
MNKMTKTILEELLEKTVKSMLDEQMKQICDQIMAEEKPKFTKPTFEPIGPNIFLAIQCSKENDILVREMKEKYIIVLMGQTTKKDMILKRQKVWEVKEDKAEKILKFYAEKLKFVKGEA